MYHNFISVGTPIMSVPVNNNLTIKENMSAISRGVPKSVRRIIYPVSCTPKPDIVIGRYIKVLTIAAINMKSIRVISPNQRVL